MRHPRCAVKVASGPVGEAIVKPPPGISVARAPVQGPVDGQRIGIQEQLGDVPALTMIGIPVARDPVGVALTRSNAWQVAVPDIGIYLGQLNPLFTAGVRRIE